MLKCQFKSLLRSKKVSSSLLTNHESQVLTLSQGQLLEIHLLESRLLDTFLGISTAGQKNGICSTEKKYAVCTFEQLIKKVQLLEISSRWQNYCDSKI